ncbi:MAG: deoxyribonuclease IV [Chloroflexi bacterium]|nr:deoxyribonuclease IV [Chloroflexota bacterium]
MRLGAHHSISGGLDRAFLAGKENACEALQLFVKSNRQWAVKPLTDEEVNLFRQRQSETGLSPVVAHASYLINLASPNSELWERSRDTLQIELERCERLGICGLVVHPGSHMESGEAQGLVQISRALGEIHARTRGYQSRIFLETMAGQGNSLGGRFEHLAWLLQNTAEGERLGICLDTCHIFAAGYDLCTPEAYSATMTEFDEIIGLHRLGAIHLNDSVGSLNSHKDRHAHIGEGLIGLEGFRAILNDHRLVHLPGLLETPKSDDLHEDVDNLARLRGLIATTE